MRARVTLPDVARVLVALGLIVGSQSPAPAGAQPASTDIAGAARDLVSQLLDAPDENSAQSAASQALAWAGLATHTGDQVLVPAQSPTMPIWVQDQEARNLGVDAHQRRSGSRRMSLAELGQMLQALGWNQDQLSIVLRDGLKDAIADAHQNSTRASSFVPLFLEAMASGSTPHADLASGTEDPDQIGLSTLEVQLLLTAMLRSDHDYPAAAPARPPVNPPGAEADQVAASVVASQPSSTFCRDVLGNLGGFQSLEKVALDRLTSLPFDHFFEHQLGIENGGARFAAVKALSIAKILTMHLVFFNLRVSEEVQQNGPPIEWADPIHHSDPDAGDSNFVVYEANAYLPESFQYGKTFFDCLAQMGFPTDPYDLTEALKDGGRVEWDPTGLGRHARLAEEGTVDSSTGTWIGGPNHFSGHAPLTSDMSFVPLAGEGNNGGNAYAHLWADMTEEQQGVHDNNQRLKRDTMWMTAKLLINRPPEKETWLKALVPGQWSDALLDVAGQFYRRMMGPTSSMPVYVTWHEAPGWNGTLEVTTSVHNRQVQPIGNQCSGDQVTESSTEGKITVSIDGTTGTGSVDRLDTSSQSLKGECPALGGFGSCHVGQTHPTDPVEQSQSVEMAWRGSGKAQVEISIDPNGSYVISAQIPSPPEKVTRKSYSTRPGCDGPITQGPTTQTDTLPGGGVVTASAQGVVDPNNPDVLQGTIGPDSGGTTTTWHLAR